MSGRGNVPKHDHVWYPISEAPDGRPVLYACSVYPRCIETKAAKHKGLDWTSYQK